MSEPSILVIDDEPAMRMAVSHSLRRKGYMVATAASGAEALNMIEQENYRLLITDMKMPGMTGLQVLSREGVDMPRTVFASNKSSAKDVIELSGGAPLVLKILEGTQGVGVVLVDSEKAAKSVLDANSNTVLRSSNNRRYSRTQPNRSCCNNWFSEALPTHN